MSFKNIEIKDSYRTDNCRDLGQFFISKMLEEAVTYKRAVGYFSSSALIKLSRGISSMIKRDNAKIYFVVSPVLHPSDIEAITKGYKKRKQIVEEALLREFVDTTDKCEIERLNFLCHLIEEEKLDIKVADINDQNDNELAIFHEKIGIFTDDEGNSVAFCGSLNESDNAFSRNFESVQVFKSYEELRRVMTIEDDFDRLWNNTTSNLEVYEFPEALKQKLLKYRKPTYYRNIDEYEDNEKQKERIISNKPKCCYNFELYDYQKSALNKWANQGYKGLFDMGTGTGKTITALTGAVKLLERSKNHLATIIVCPYTHLVEQWVEEKENFNIEFIVGYSSNKYRNYLSKLRMAVQNYNDGIIPYFFFITTNASYRIAAVQEILKQIRGPALFIADEVHNIGAEGLKNALIDNFKYRIGLSATIDRHRDEEGTKAIYDYFGEKCIEYGLKEAIRDNVLTRYYYYPIVVSLNENEQEEYMRLTALIRKNSYPTKDGVKLSSQAEKIAIERARLIASAYNKLDALRQLMKKHKNDNNLLIYCGTGKIQKDIDVEVRQIEEVCNILGNELGMKIERYTSQESTEERKRITQRYKDGSLQAIVAIKCLDEGVNIPSIETAFVLASSTNPREYIQRRGRVLRKFDGKDYSYIYDFITLPIPLTEVNEYSEEYLEGFISLVHKEIERMKEFSSLAENEHNSDQLINEIIQKFKLNKFERAENFEKIEWSEENEY